MKSLPRGPATVELRDGVWGCWACAAPARELPDMTRAIEARNPHAHVFAVIDHKPGCPHWTSSATRYHVLISDELAEQMLSNPERLPPSFRLVDQEPTDPERHRGMHWWLCEDADAGPELEGKRVELTIMRGRMNEADLYEGTWISERRVLP